jgi:hypothetical protein
MSFSTSITEIVRADFTKKKRVRIDKQIIIFLFFVLVNSLHLYGQNNRITTNNSIGWYNYFGTFKVSKKLGIHTEYQWRRNNFITDWQQSLLRVGLNYNLNARVMFRLGYASVESYPYGDIPLNSLGRNYSENRIFEAVQIAHKEGIVDLSHRIMLEQRFVGRYSSAAAITEDQFPLQNRIRYMIRLQVPLKGNEIKDKTPYLAFYDEIFIAFGKNVNANIFDQNRIGILLGYRFSKEFKIEGGYLNQTIQYGRQINGSNVFQNNNGIVLSSIFNFDLAK